MALLTAKGLFLGYEGQSVAENISFTVEPGDYLCVIGENGSGKTTLIRTILGLVKPLSGQIALGEGLEKNQIGYLPQQDEIQRDFPASVEEIVLSGNLHHLGWHPFYRKEDRARAKEAMEKMGILHLAQHPYRALSGGQQQRVLLARALVAADRLLVLDEPVSGLDPVVTAEMYSLIRTLHEEGMTMIMITHDVTTALSEATHILHMGKTVFFGTREQYLEQEKGEEQ